jgi:hypothetical protein
MATMTLIMKFDVILTTLCLSSVPGFVLVDQGRAASDSQGPLIILLAQASPQTADITTTNQGIGLTASHKQIIYDNIASEQEQSLVGDLQLAIGSTIPDSLNLNAMPIAVKDQVGVLKDFKFVRLRDDKVLIVDPASRKVMDVITKEQAGR